MKEKVFLDTNILMDIVENREKREYAETIIELDFHVYSLNSHNSPIPIHISILNFQFVVSVLSSP